MSIIVFPIYFKNNFCSDIFVSEIVNNGKFWQELQVDLLQFECFLPLFRHCLKIQHYSVKNFQLKKVFCRWAHSKYFILQSLFHRIKDFYEYEIPRKIGQDLLRWLWFWIKLALKLSRAKFCTLRPLKSTGIVGVLWCSL